MQNSIPEENTNSITMRKSTKNFQSFDIDDVKVNYGYLTDSGIESLSNLLPETPTNQPAIKMFPENLAWDTHGINLPLCEFLAYKAALAYGTNDDIEQALNLSRYSNFSFFDFQKTGVVDTQAFGFVFDETIFIIFRGSEKKEDWKSNFDDVLTKEKPSWTWQFWKNKEHERFHVEGQHRGFARSWGVVRNQIEDWIGTIESVSEQHKKRVIFSGHSLGGALAIIGAYEFQKFHDDREVAAVVTFGAPMVGNTIFANNYKQANLEERTIRLVSDGDIVPQIMGRWYYRLSVPIRNMINQQVRKKQEIVQSENKHFAHVGKEWYFDRIPLLGRQEFERALQEIAKNLQKDSLASEKNEKPEAETTDKSDRETDTISRKKEAKSEPDKEKNGNPIVTWSIIILVAAVISGVLYFILRNKLKSSHDIQKRYALYLSSLSYRRLRELKQNDVSLANDVLDQHLSLIRGEVGDNHYLKEIKSLPVRFNPDDDIETFVRERQEEYVV